MNYYRFSWCVCSFDQECIITAKNEKKAKEIFKKEVIGDNTTWAANFAHCSNLNKIYTKEHLKKFKVNFTE